MKRKRDMRRTDWRGITKREYVTCEGTCCGWSGIVSLLVMDEVSQPLSVQCKQKKTTIVQQDYSWLQFAFRDEYFWVTAMFDQQDRLFQVYFDITSGNLLDPPENPSFQDLYRDIVLEADGTLQLLDREELDEAYQREEINCDEYMLALQEGKKLYDYLKEHSHELLQCCCEWQRKLKGRIKDGTD